MNKTFILYILFGLLVWLSPKQADAATIPVVDISRRPDQVSLKPKLSEVPATVGEKTFSSRSTTTTTKPLFLQQKAVEPQEVSTHTNPRAVYEWVMEQATLVNHEPVDAELVVADNKAESFTPPQNGFVTDTRATTLALLKAIDTNKPTDIEVSGYYSEPRVTLADVNNLGITELVGEGLSYFKGSSSNRRANIKAGMEKVRGSIIKPGEEFSFNKNLGPIEAQFGFKPEIVIKSTGLVPELGGGICQVSSTVFRAAMAAGLPVQQRKNHSFAVSHYSPQGTDATVYDPVLDLKFTNDTPGHILVWAYLKDKDTLVFDFYGTRDSRKVVLEEPTQFDRKTDGSMKAAWVRHTTNNGETKTDTFRSVYLPPAQFKKQEEFVPGAAGTTPPTTTTTPPPAGGTSPAPVTQ